MTTGVDAETVSVVTVKVADVAPARMVTLAGTVAALALPLESVTRAPAGGALPVRVAVPVEAVPLTTVVGLTVTVERAAGVTV
jgi:hypothetical protein